jgi:hypothetical protein
MATVGRVHELSQLWMRLKRSEMLSDHPGRAGEAGHGATGKRERDDDVVASVEEGGSSAAASSQERPTSRYRGGWPPTCSVNRILCREKWPYEPVEDERFVASTKVVLALGLPSGDS